jgi:hypothetical protein
VNPMKITIRMRKRTLLCGSSTQTSRSGEMASPGAAAGLVLRPQASLTRWIGTATASSVPPNAEVAGGSSARVVLRPTFDQKLTCPSHPITRAGRIRPSAKCGVARSSWV